MSVNIHTILNANLPKAWLMLDSVLKPCQYHAVVTQPYNTETGTTPSTVTTTSLKAFMYDHDLSLVGDGADIQASDKLAIVLANDLPEIAGREKAEPGDRFTDHKGKVWNVLLARGAPDYYFELTLRR